MLLQHSTVHARGDRPSPKHGTPLRVLAKCCASSVGDQLPPAPLVGKLKGDRSDHPGLHYQACVNPSCLKTGARQLLRQDWGSMPGVLRRGLRRYPRSGHHAALVAIFRRRFPCSSSDGGTHGHPGVSAAGAAATGVALEACVKARQNAGREIEKEKRDIS